MLTHLDLFSGIGGFALAARWHGIKTVGFCEIDPWCQRVLRKHWPDVPIHGDIHDLSFSGEWVDFITGGFPCQPFSVAGKRMGEEDDRALWPQMLRVIRECRPSYVLGENVAGIITLGIDRVLSDLEEIGYSCRSVVVPACAVGAPHRRDRVWIMAHSGEHGSTTRRERPDHPAEVAGRRAHGTGSNGHAAWAASSGSTGEDSGALANANGTGRREQRWAVADEPQYATAFSGGGREVEPGLGGALDGLPGWLARPWDGGWEDGVPRVTDGCPDRSRKLKSLGNSIVPQVAYVLMGAMLEC